MCDVSISVFIDNDVPRLGGAGSTEPGAATVTMSWTLGSAQPWAILAVPIKPAPAFEAASLATTTNSTTCTWSHTVGSGPNRFLLVGVSVRKDGVTLPTVSSITYAGLALTRVGAVANGSNVRAEMWRLLNPPTGSSNVVVTLSAAASAVCGATSWTNVNQSTPLGSAVTATGNSTAPSKAVSSATGQIVQDVLGATTDVAASVGVGQTQRWNGAAAPTVRGAGSTKPGAATVTMSWTLGSAQPWAILAVPIKPP